MPDTLASGYTVADLCQRWRIGGDKIRALIRAGRLTAINTAMNESTKPRFVILPEEVSRFEQRRAVGPTPKTPKRRRKTTEVDYYP